ncbi:hypothetical protein FEM48_Zijuj02G0205700 [Ziziphus jujuba var. spinosa]|uniref:PB1 domain-containing protein n=1 Tax=Ziziphus jujuba var. spinosa TaxID=714518 RepID=A0A978VXU8_ZIZJJ|nr:hypothetical protein FEM48_Zijuj02G0205700 [Ziziphus jujuba var. spinosa]
MAGEAEGAGEEYPSSSSSPKNRVKFLCSHGGKILPRPSDGHLKYVGGDTRVVAVPHDITFSDLMERLTSLFEGDMVLKYQLISEDLDTLVSVRTDEDLKHMLDEYNRQENRGTPRLRTFLFPSKPTILDNQAAFLEPRALELRYVDAVNGIIRTNSRPKLTPIDVNCSSFSISSACSSPNSPSPRGALCDQLGRVTSTMHKVQSSPSICSLDNFQHHTNHNHLQQHYNYHYHHHHGFGNQSQRPPLDLHKERLASSLSMGRSLHMGHSSGHGHGHGYGLAHSTNRHHRGSSGGCTKCGYHDDQCPLYGCSRVDRADSLPRSPRKTLWE